MVVRVLVATALALGAFGCSTDGSDEAKPRTAPRLEVADALGHAPLDQPFGSDLAADDHGIWDTDFTSLAHYDVRSGAWSTRRWPLPAGSIENAVFQTLPSGDLAAIVASCVDRRCASEDPDIHLQALVVDRSGFHRLALRGGVSEVLETDDASLRSVGVLHGMATFAVVRHDSTLLHLGLGPSDLGRGAPGSARAGVRRRRRPDRRRDELARDRRRRSHPSSPVRTPSTSPPSVPPPRRTVLSTRAAASSAHPMASLPWAPPMHGS